MFTAPESERSIQMGLRRASVLTPDQLTQIVQPGNIGPELPSDDEDKFIGVSL
jgi:hypothetical protein